MKIIELDQKQLELNKILIEAIKSNNNNIDRSIKSSKDYIKEDQERLISENKEFKRLMNFIL